MINIRKIRDIRGFGAFVRSLFGGSVTFNNGGVTFNDGYVTYGTPETGSITAIEDGTLTPPATGEITEIDDETDITPPATMGQPVIS